MIKRALISVYDKTGIVEFAKELSKLNIEIISTGGTYRILKENNISVRSVEEITGFPEVLDGRVKTLHPKIFAAILANIENQKHKDELFKIGVEPVGLVVVNLYPFQKTISEKDVTVSGAIEQIDIGGVTLIRAAAKNFNNVNVLVDAKQYPQYLELLKSNSGEIPVEYSQRLAQTAFGHTSAYDRAIENYFGKLNRDESKLNFPATFNSPGHQLRYGENPHQKAILIKENFDEVFEILHGKELSYNNLLDIDAAINIISEFENANPACAIIKHGNPSGVAVSESLQAAYANAFSTDALSPFGGIIVFNQKLDFKTSLDIDKLFAEIILAPDFENDALDFLKKKKNRRLVKFNFAKENSEFRKIIGGVLHQEKDNLTLNRNDLKFVTKRKATEDEVDDMLFAFKVVKHAKSNAIVFVKDKKTLAIGAGQPSRIDSTKIAISKAKEFGHELKNSVAASDAFFPFTDGLIEIAKAGAAAVIQPGGSVNDDEVVKAADEFNIAMAFTGIRHFRH